MSELLKKIRRAIIGASRDVKDPDTFHKLSLIAFLAWVGLGSDGLSSSCYGPSEVMTALGTHYYLGIIIGLASVFTIIIISASYSHIIELFPSGGGGYLVATKLLSPKAGMISGAALIIDYVLTITVSIASGTDAIFSFIPLQWHYLRLPFALLCVVFMTILNMRGAKESVLPLVPIFVIFLITHVFVIGYAIFSNFYSLPQIAHNTVVDYSNTVHNLGTFGALFLIMHAYSMGAGTYTGIEAVSNGLPILRDPKVHTAKKTMRYMAASLSVMVLGLMIAYLITNSHFQEGKTLNAVLFSNITTTWSPSVAYTFIIITLISEGAILLVAAQTGFLDGPRVLANMALDRWVPTRLAALSDRLVTQNGIVLMGVASFLLMLFSNGVVTFLLVLYSINVFLTFSLSQLGMVRHWWQVRKNEKRWLKNIIINGTGLILTVFILITVVIVKFHEGGWITMVITGILICLLLLVKNHYNKIQKEIKKLDSLIDDIDVLNKMQIADKSAEAKFDNSAETAVVLVNGYSGLGLHTLFGIFRMFKRTFKNFVFVQVGVIDAGLLKTSEDIENYENKIVSDLDKYKNLLIKAGYFADSYYSVGIDVLEELDKILKIITQKYPNAIFFGGQLAFEEENFVTRMLHNNTIITLKRQLYYKGFSCIILPIKL